jgi:hypothetical protein
MSYWKWLLVEKNNVWADPLLPWRIGLTAVPAANHIKLDILDKPYFPKPYYEGNYIFPKPYYETLKKIPESFNQTLYHTNLISVKPGV